MRQIFSLKKYFWKYKWRFLLGICFVVLTNYFRILYTQITGYVINTVINHIARGREAISNVSTGNDDNLVKHTRVFQFAIVQRQNILFGIHFDRSSAHQRFLYVPEAAKYHRDESTD